MVSIFSCFLISSAPALGGNCTLADLDAGRGERIAVQYAYDGDTLTLSDGRRIRLIGINTPERGRKGQPDEALALAAKQAVQSALQASGARQRDLRLVLGREQTDAYGRQLGYVFIDGQSLSALLLKQGLGWHVAIPPNLGLLPCFVGAEKSARRGQKGLWQSTLAQYVGAKNIERGGYQRVRGTVRKVSFAKAWWINFEDGFVAVIYPENQRYFDKATVNSWRGKRLEVEGWVYSSKYRGKPQWRIKLATPHGLSVL
ncbi:MAG: thermonuclease family protein [Gammaproteobacteria bacterium]|nr:thermonuclease family protein [Gammaproteobacteria bacterium]MBQ0839827.1 thermonuclease family protein [Gammaproteobacteria bacterium]